MKRHLERQYPPFGVIPGFVRGDHQLLVRVDGLGLSLAAFFAVPTGVLATLRTATTRPELTGVLFSIEQLTLNTPTQMEIFAEDIADTASSSPSEASIVSGSRGQDGGVDYRVFLLWFPIDISTLTVGLRFTIDWWEAGMDAQTLDIPRDDLAAAAEASFEV